MVLKIPEIPVPNEMVLENPGTKRLFGTIQGWDFFNGGNHLFITQKKRKVDVQPLVVPRGATKP